MPFHPEPRDSLAVQLSAARDWLEAERLGALYPLIAELVSRVDAPRWQALVARYSREGEARGAYKYLALPYWLARAARAAFIHGLTCGHPRHILDLGAGGCHFAAVCAALGHSTENLDVPGRNSGFDEVSALLGVTVTRHRIEPRQPLCRFPRRFDLVTAHLANFHLRPERAGAGYRSFSPEDWAYLLNDLVANHLNMPATVHFELNPSVDAANGQPFHDPAMLAWFKASGAIFGRGALPDAVSFDISARRPFLPSEGIQS